MIDLGHHGDAELAPGLADFAVNVRLPGPPAWLAQRIAASLANLGAYPDPGEATAAVAAVHGRPVEQVLLTAGSAEGFTLLARTLTPSHTVMIHPQFTEPERAFVAEGHRVDRVTLSVTSGFGLDRALVPETADLVLIGNPTNPTSVLHPAATIEALIRPGRFVVVDEAFMDFVPGGAWSLAGRSDLPGLIVSRSLTKMWGLAGLRIGYLLAAPEVIDAIKAHQPQWAVSSPALAAAIACSEPAALVEAERAAQQLATWRDQLAGDLTGLGLTIPAVSRAPFLLARSNRTDLWQRFREAGFAVRRADTFPGLGEQWIRIAVRDPASNARLLRTLESILIRPAST